MNKLAKIFSAGFCNLIFLISCNDKNNSSPFSEIVNKPPYSSLTDSIKKEPDRDELYFRRAILLNKNELPEPALADFQKAWSIHKDERYALGISTILMDRRSDSALFFLQDALKVLPASYLLRLNLARTYDNMGDIEKALATTREILADNPEQVDVLKMQADLLDKEEKPDSAMLVLEKAYRLVPFDIDLNYALAYKYAENKDAKVVALCDSLIKKDSLNLHAEPYYYKGIYYSNINDKTRALALFNEAIVKDYYYLNAYIEKGRVQFDQKKFNEALATFQLANTISATFPDAYFWMGKCQEALGQKEEANLNYQRAYALDKTFTEAKEAADRLSKE